MIGIKKSSARLHLSKMSGACGTRGGGRKTKTRHEWQARAHTGNVSNPRVPGFYLLLCCQLLSVRFVDMQSASPEVSVL